MTHTRLQPQRSSSLKSSPWNDVWLSLRPPGAPLGLHVLEVRDTSLVVLWDAPAFSGRSPVIGYYLDIKEAAGGDGAWRAVHEKVHQIKYMKVTDAWGRMGGRSELPSPLGLGGGAAGPCSVPVSSL